MEWYKKVKKKKSPDEKGREWIAGETAIPTTTTPPPPAEVEGMISALRRKKKRPEERKNPKGRNGVDEEVHPCYLLPRRLRHTHKRPY
ncbi:hypothetical protein RUM43_001627 [Polyplax serrata]|uniref:Uncharacterized protein n=1 Tax=Polyplax serrata TaxID=468196 RepID=A0AAN8SGJ0_POLSC